MDARWELPIRNVRTFAISNIHLKEQYRWRPPADAAAQAGRGRLLSVAGFTAIRPSAVPVT